MVLCRYRVHETQRYSGGAGGSAAKGGGAAEPRQGRERGRQDHRVLYRIGGPMEEGAAEARRPGAKGQAPSRPEGSSERDAEAAAGIAAEEGGRGRRVRV